MATINFNQPLPPQYGTGTITAVAADHITNSYLSIGVDDDYAGSFIFSGNILVGGSVTSIVETQGGTTIFSATGLDAFSPGVVNAILTDDATTFTKLVFGGDDSIQGSAGGDILGGFGGNDSIIALDGDDTVSGGDGADDVNGNKGQDSVLGGNGADTVRGGQGDDTVSGDDGDDGHVNGNLGNDSVSGGNGNDTVYGGQGSDTLHGDAGNDLLSGDLGNDTLYGDAGADRFSIARGGGFDWVADFHASEGDKIQLAPGTAYTVTSVGGQVVIDLGGGDELGLVGVPAGSFSTDWIVFG